MAHSDPQGFVPPSPPRPDSAVSVDVPGEMSAHLPPRIRQDGLDAAMRRLSRAA